MTRWEGTRAELRARIKVAQPKAVWEALEAPEEATNGKSLYSNVRCQLDGINFDSLAEMGRYSELRLLERAGAISNLLPCPNQPKKERFALAGGRKPPMYTPDFTYIENGRRVAEDVKGQRRGKGSKGTSDAAFVLRAKLFRERYPDIELRIVER